MILYTLSALVQCNYIHHYYAAPAIWIDFKNRNTRVCRNLAHDISSYHGAIFFDASDERNMIDHNLVMHVHGNGIYQHDCDLVVIAHNLVVDCDYFGRAHPADQVPVGPFIEGWSKVRRQLQLVPNS